MISDDLTQIRERIDEIVDFSRDVAKELNELKLLSNEQFQTLPQYLRLKTFLVS